MDKDRKKFESVYSNKVKAGKRRTYFVDVRQTKGNDYYLTITESTKRFDSDQYERHKIFLYKEDFNRFRDAVNDAINHVQTELMPDYDYDEFTRRNEEYERMKAAENAEKAKNEAQKEEASEDAGNDADEADDSGDTEEKDISSEEDMSW